MSGSYSFKIGTFNCTVLADGHAVYGMHKLIKRFPNVLEDDLADALTLLREDPDHQTTYYNPLLIQTESHNILVDSGESTARHAEAGHTLACLNQLGLGSQDIDTVILTHAHGDHIIGLFEPDTGERRYPNATYWMNQIEWDFWTDLDSLERWNMLESGSQTRNWLRQLEEDVRFIDLDRPIQPGIEVVPAYGHTAGHFCLKLHSQGETLFHGVDLVHSPIQFPYPEWTVKFDTDPDLARESRLKLFNMLAEEHWLTLFYHMPFPGLGHIVNGQPGYKWKPIL